MNRRQRTLDARGIKPGRFRPEAEHRSSYLNGWEFETLRPSKNYSGQSGEFFQAGIDESRLLTKKAA